MPIPGVDVLLEDEAVIASLPTATDTTLLLSGDSNAPTTPTLAFRADEVRSDFASATTMIAEADALFGEGVQRLYLLKVDTANLATTLAKMPRDLGPMQVVAPPVVTAAGIQTIATWALSTNRTYLPNAADGVADTALETLAATVIANSDGRNSAIFHDTAIIPGAGSTTREVPWSLIVAGIIARNDTRAGGGNPNLAAGGVNGIARYARGVTDPRAEDQIADLAAAQVNSAKVVAGQLRNYGYRTLADLDTLPQWWDLGGSRTVMDLRAYVRAASEDEVFAQIDGQGTVEGRVSSIISGRCLQLLELGALFGGKDERGNPIAPFTVDTSRAVNPIAQVAQGRVRALVGVRTSPYLEHLTVPIVKQQLATGVA